MNGNYLDLSQRTMKTMGAIDQVIVDNRVYKMLRARRDEIEQAIGDRTVDPSCDLLRELAELNAELGDDAIEAAFQDPIDELRAELKEDEKETVRARLRAEIAAETDDVSRWCLEHSLALLDDPDWIGNA